MNKELYCMLEKPHLHKYGFVVQKIILGTILLNLFSILAIYVFSLGSTAAWVFQTLNTVTVLIFVVELLLRYIAVGEDEKYAGLRGRIRFTFSFYTLVDIVAILPFFLTFGTLNSSFLRAVRLMRFLRILKLIRMEKVFKNLFSLHHFVSSGIMLQSIVLFGASVVIIYFFSYGYGSVVKSAMVFLDPPQVAELRENFQIFIGVLELILGLVVGGALISIITSAFIDIIESIKDGGFPYKGKEHIVIINTNAKLKFVLSEIDKYYAYKEEEQDVVILLPSSDIRASMETLGHYESLEIYFVSGDLLSWNTYERIGINKAKKLLSLFDAQAKQSKKTMQFILSHEEFKNDNMDFVIETDSMMHSKEIYKYIFDNTSHDYTVVDNKHLIGKILNRSIVNYDYFKILTELLTYSGFEFYILEYDVLFKESLSFETASLQIGEAVLVGIVRDEEVILNPLRSDMLHSSDKLILIMENMFSYTIEPKIEQHTTECKIQKPSLREERKILIVGKHTDIKTEDITHFITQNSIENLECFVSDDDCYTKKEIWERFRQKDFDIIILNIEDEDEYELTLYLRSIYSNDEAFLEKIVNIIHDPTNAMLLSGKRQNNSIILSQKIIGEFMVQSLFNPYIPSIFDEITQAKGNEFYLLERDSYEALFALEYRVLKATCIKNDMIYIGGFCRGSFVFDAKNTEDLEKIIVLSQGVVGVKNSMCI